MALTPAQRNQQRKRAAQQAEAVEPGQTMEGANTYELQLAQLAQDRARLKQIQSTQGKAELKRQLLPSYQPYVAGVLAGGRGAQDDVLTTIMLWDIDAAEYSAALDIAEYVIQHSLKMPDRFERTTGCLIAEEVADAALKLQKAGSAFELPVLERAQELTNAQDMPDEVRAKLHLALGRAYLWANTQEGVKVDLEQLGIARQHLATAIELHSHCGGKKELDQADRLLKKLAPASAAPAQEEQGEHSQEPQQQAKDDEPAQQEQGESAEA